MKAYIKRGDSLFIPFAQGLSIPGMQKKLKVYKSLENLEKSKPTFYQLDDNVEVVEYAEVKHGKWVAKKKWQSGKWHKWLECSCCGAEDWNYRMYEDVPFCGNLNYCPNCGADMRGGKEE